MSNDIGLGTIVASHAKVDSISENTNGNGIILQHGLYTSSGTEIISASGALGGNVEYTIFVGMVASFAMETAPNGWLVCDGSVLSRTTYASLFSAIGTTWGAGDGYTTFNLPDLRGQFLRGFNNGAGVDPDAASRTGGDAVGSSQDYAIQRHKHKTQAAVVYSNGAASANRSSASETGGTWWTSGPFDQVTGVFIGKNETRPKNKYVQYCIKY